MKVFYIMEGNIKKGTLKIKKLVFFKNYNNSIIFLVIVFSNK